MKITNTGMTSPEMQSQNKWILWEMFFTKFECTSLTVSYVKHERYIN